MKRFFSLVLVATMVLCNIPTGIFATETEATTSASTSTTTVPIATTAMSLPGGAEILEIIDITPNMSNDGMIVLPTSRSTTTILDQSWTFKGHHQGSNRSYSQNSIGFAVYLSSSSGTSLSDEISIELKDYYNHTQYFTAYANKTWYYNDYISIVSGRTYYFYYNDLTNGSRNLSIHMIIYRY